MSKSQPNVASIRNAIHIGMSADDVFQWLRDNQIENSGYLAKDRTIQAALRNQGHDGVVSRSVLLTFRFDTNNKLTAIESKDGFTGP